MVVMAPTQQAQEIRDLVSPSGQTARMQPGSVWYPVAIDWLRHFRKYTGLEENENQQVSVFCIHFGVF